MRSSEAVKHPRVIRVSGSFHFTYTGFDTKTTPQCLEASTDLTNCTVRSNSAKYHGCGVQLGVAACGLGTQTRVVQKWSKFEQKAAGWNLPYVLRGLFLLFR
jgi:hypothetical protein